MQPLLSTETGTGTKATRSPRQQSLAQQKADLDEEARIKRRLAIVTAYYLLLTAYASLPTPYCLRLTAYHTAYCLLLTAYSSPLTIHRSLLTMTQARMKRLAEKKAELENFADPVNAAKKRELEAFAAA